MTIYYVSSEIGSNNNAGTSESTPLASLQAAEALVKPGDTVEVMNGTYTGNAPGGGDVLDITTSGTASAPITFEAAPGQTPVINSSGGWNAINIEGASYIVIKGFTIVGDAANYTLSQALAQYSTGNANLDGNGIAVTTPGGGVVPNHITIENNTVYNEPGAGIYTQGADYLQILNNVVYDNAHWSAWGTSGISIGVLANSDTNAGVHDIISGNLVFGNAQLVPTTGSNNITDGEGIILDTNPGYVGEILVENNTVYKNGSSGIESFLTDNAVITGNTVYGNDTQNVQAASVAQIFINQSNNDTVTNNITTAPNLTPPAAPVISGDTVNFGNTVTLNGTAEAGSTITVYDNSTQLGTTVTNGSGVWTFTTGALANGSESFTVAAIDSVGNVSPLSSALVMTLNTPVNLVANGNFATGDFTHWTLGGNETFGQIVIDTNTEGGSTYAAGMGSMGADGTLSQTIATTAGQTYTLSFWLQNEGSGGNDFQAIWNGQTLLSLTNAAASGYTEYTYNVTATGSTTTLEFSAANGPSQWDLDNISLTPNGTSPAVASIAESPSSGDLHAGQPGTVTLNLSEAVNVSGGTPTLTLNDGGVATYTGGSGTSALTFSYTVAAGQNAPSLAATAVNLNGATIADGAGNAASLSLSGLTQSGPQIDAVTPALASIVESPSSGDLHAGQTGTVTLHLSEAVNVSGGTPTLTLNDGGVATYTGGSGTSALTFSYTVATGQNAPSLAATAVNLNGATIADGAGNAASLSLSGLTQSGPQIDAVTPALASIAETPSSGDLHAGQTGTLTLHLSEAVNVSGGTPTLTLNDGGVATYTGGSGTSALTFSYTVAAGQNTAALSATTVNLNGASIADGAGNAASLSLSGLTQSGPQIDTTPPNAPVISSDTVSGNVIALTGTAEANSTIKVYDNGAALVGTTQASSSGAWSLTTTSLPTGANALTATATDGAGNISALSAPVDPTIGAVTPAVASIVESPSSGDLHAGQTGTLTLHLSEAVNVSGGTPTLTLNDGGVATYTGGSGTSALTFSYTVATGQNAPSLAATAVNLNGATIADGAGNAASLSLAGLTQSGPQIDAVTPALASIVESPSSGDLHAGQTGTLTLHLSEAVNVSGGTPTLTLNDGGVATYTGGSGTSALTFSYTVAAGQNAPSLAATAVNLNGATIADGAGNAASLSLSGLTQSGPQIDAVTPALASIVESPSSGDLHAGQTGTVTLHLSEAVNVSGGTPTLTLNDGGVATYTGGSGTSTLTFSYTVATGQNAPSLAATAVNLNGATIADGAGNAASLSLSGLTQSGPQIDAVTPALASIAETPSSGDLHAGQTGTVTLHLSEAVNVSGGTPTLTLNDGGVATYTGGSGTSALTFSYTVATGQNAPSLAATAVNLNGASIADGAGNAASLSLSGLTQSGPQIDTTPPNAPVISSDTVSGNVIALTGTAEANSTIKVYDNGAALVGTTQASSSGAWSLTTTSLPTGANALTATATDGAGNISALSAPVDPTIGAVTPAVASIAESPSSGDLHAGQTGTLTVHLSEAVNVSGGTPTLTLNDGGIATYTGGSGTSALTFSYTVAAGQNAPSLAATAVNLNGATIADGAGNAASLSLAGLTQSGPQIDYRPPLHSLSAPVITYEQVFGNHALLSGMAEAHDTIKIYDNGVLIGTTSSNSSGNWTMLTKSLPTGANVFVATATDASGKTSAPSAPMDPMIGKTVTPSVASIATPTAETNDILQPGPNAFQEFAASLNHASQVGSGAGITLDNGHADIHVNVINKASLGSGYFHLV